MLTALDHVILGVRDLESAARRYARMLGREISWRGEHPGAGTENVLFRLGNTYLELLAPSASNSGPEPGPSGQALGAFLDARGEGPVGLAFATDDAEACHRLLAERGFDPEPIEKGMGRDVDSGAFREWRRVPLPLSRTRGVLLFAIEHTTPDALLPPAGVAGDESAVVSGLDHAVVQSTDADATRALYGEGLGLRLALDKSFPDWGMRLLFFRIGGLTVEIAARLDTALDTQVEAKDASGDRLWGLSYRVPDADAARARLAAADFDVSEVRTGRKPGTRVFSLRGETHGVPTLMLEPPAETQARAKESS